MDLLPGAESLRQIAPGNAGTVAIEHGLHEQAVIPGGHAHVPGAAGQQRVGTLEVVRLPGREGKAGRVAERVDRGVDLGAQAASAAPDRLVVGAVFLTAPALC